MEYNLLNCVQNKGFYIHFTKRLVKAIFSKVVLWFGNLKKTCNSEYAVRVLYGGVVFTFYGVVEAREEIISTNFHVHYSITPMKWSALKQQLIARYLIKHKISTIICLNISYNNTQKYKASFRFPIEHCKYLFFQTMEK